MHEEAKVRVARVKGLMRGFLEVGLIEDAGLYARELRAVRTEITRAIVVLETQEGVPAESDSGCTS
jgi:hypothetical protein